MEQRSQIRGNSTAAANRRQTPGRNGAPGTANSASTRERILACAGRLFAHQGFDNTSIRVIAQESGITPGAVYKHFASKADLLFEVVKRAIESIPLFVQGDHDATALPILAAAYTEPGLKLLRRVSIELHSASTRDRKVQRVLSRSDELAMNRVGEDIARAQREGRLDARLEPDFAARLFSVIIMGLTHMDTLLPHLVGDPAWRDFVRDSVAKLIGVRPAG